MVRRRRGPVVPVVLAVAAFVLAACGTPGTDAEARQVSGAVVREAAQRTGELTSGRTVVTTRFEGFDGLLAPGEGAEVVVEGAFDTATQRATASVDLAQVAEAVGGSVGRLGAALLPGLFDEPTVAVVDGAVLYVSSPLLDLADSPTSWVSQPLEPGALSPGVAGGVVDPLGLDALDSARSFIAYLEGVADDVTEVGTATVGGVSTTRYEGRVDLQALVDTLPAPDQARARAGLADLGTTVVPFTVWIDDAGLVRKVELTMADVALGAPEIGQGTVVVTAELVDPDQPVDVVVPPADQVSPAAALDGGVFTDSALLPRLGR